MHGKENEILFSILVFLVGISVIFSWWRFLYQENYDLYATIDCDPAIERCFVYEDPECADEECAWNYKVVVAPTKIVSDCAPDSGECLIDMCRNSGECSTVLCSEESKEEFAIEDACSF